MGSALVIEKQKNKYRKYTQTAPNEQYYEVMVKFGLSVREAETYFLMLEGKTRKEIQAKLGIGSSATSYALSMVHYKTGIQRGRRGKNAAK